MYQKVGLVEETKRERKEGKKQVGTNLATVAFGCV
jgi:hypothetical protein